MGGSLQSVRLTSWLLRTAYARIIACIIMLLKFWREHPGVPFETGARGQGSPLIAMFELRLHILIDPTRDWGQRSPLSRSTICESSSSVPTSAVHVCSISGCLRGFVSSFRCLATIYGLRLSTLTRFLFRFLYSFHLPYLGSP